MIGQEDEDKIWKCFREAKKLMCKDISKTPKVENQISKIVEMWLRNREYTIGPCGARFGPRLPKGAHMCNGDTCGKFIEMISKEHQLYGCLLSGYTHQCLADGSNCHWLESDSIGNMHCVYSGVCRGNTMLDIYQSVRDRCVSVDEIVSAHEEQEIDVVQSLRKKAYSKQMFQSRIPDDRATSDRTFLETDRIKGKDAYKTISTKTHKSSSGRKWKHQTRGDLASSSPSLSSIRTYDGPVNAMDGTSIEVNTWTGKRGSRGAHRYSKGRAKQGSMESFAHVKVNLSRDDVLNPNHLKRTRFDDVSLFAHLACVVCDDLRSGNAFETFCLELENEANILLHVIMSKGKIRDLHTANVKNDMLKHIRKQISKYLTECNNHNLAPNMHVMDNIYDSHMTKLHATENAGQVISPLVILKTWAQIGVTAWLVYMLSIGGYPFVNSERGNRVVDCIFQTSKERSVFAKKVRGNIHPISYSSCFRRFILGFIFKIGHGDIIVDKTVVIKRNMDIYKSIPSYEILDGISSAAAQLAVNMHVNKKTDSTSILGSLGNQLDILLNGRLLSTLSIKEANIIVLKFVPSIEKAKVGPLFINTITHIIETQGYHRHTPSDEKKITAKPFNLLEDGFMNNISPYMTILSKYATMPSL